MYASWFLAPLTFLALVPLQESTSPRRVALSAAPPGALRIEGGEAVMGTATEVAREKVRTHPETLSRWAAQVPRHGVDVAPFWLQATEVTHAEYFEYVRATGARPVLEWGRTAVEEARQAFLEEQEALRREARGNRKRPPERRTFDEVGWWNANWRDVAWSLPSSLSNHPVTYVDQTQARAFADWCGMRLPSEAELVRAARGSRDIDYPWGAPFDPERVLSRETAEELLPVGSRGADARGFVDLVGSVWEWTTTPFAPYPGFEQLRVELEEQGRTRTLVGSPAFDPDKRVLFGGSWRQGEDGVRIATRYGAPRSLSRDAVGLRCAASLAPAVDRARRLAEGQVADHAPDLAVGIDRWRVVADPPQGQAGGVIGYDCLVFVPVLQLDAREPRDLERVARGGGETAVGLFQTSLDLASPALPAGTYRVSHGRAPEQEARSRGTGWLFRDASGVAVAFVPGSAKAGRLESGGRVEGTADGLRFEPRVALRSRGRGLNFTWNLRAEGGFGEGWRLPSVDR